MPEYEPLWKRIGSQDLTPEDGPEAVKMRDERGCFLPGHTPPHKKFKNGAIDLWLAAVAYFKHCDENPVYEQKMSNKGTLMDVSRPRPYTKQALYAMLGINTRGVTWSAWRTEGHPGYRPELHPAMEAIDAVFADQKMSLGLLGIFNPMLVARDLQLSDNLNTVNQTELTAKGGVATFSVEDYSGVPMFPHPDDPDPEGLEGPPILYTQAQLDAGVPYVPRGERRPWIIEDQ